MVGKTSKEVAEPFKEQHSQASLALKSVDSRAWGRCDTKGIEFLSNRNDCDTVFFVLLIRLKRSF